MLSSRLPAPSNGSEGVSYGFDCCTGAVTTVLPPSSISRMPSIGGWIRRRTVSPAFNTVVGGTSPPSRRMVICNGNAVLVIANWAISSATLCVSAPAIWPCCPCWDGDGAAVCCCRPLAEEMALLDGAGGGGGGEGAGAEARARGRWGVRGRGPGAGGREFRARIAIFFRLSAASD